MDIVEYDVDVDVSLPDGNFETIVKKIVNGECVGYATDGEVQKMIQDEIDQIKKKLK